MDTLAGATGFSTLDFVDGYWPVEVVEEDCENMAFTTGQGLYQFISMAMGLKFQQLMRLPWHVCKVYPDDTLI